jgi:hypothetical protein
VQPPPAVAPPSAPGPSSQSAPPNPYAPPNYAPYGAYGQYGAAPLYPGLQPTSGLAIASLILGLVGWIPCGIGSVVGVILGFVARSNIRSQHGAQGGDGLALAGIILGFVGIAFWILIFAVRLGSGS